MKIAIIAVGKVKEKPVRAILEDYLERVRRYARLEEIELRDGSESEVQDRFRKAIDPRAKVVALEVDGEAWSSERLARFVGDCELRSVSSIAFLIGGSYGLPPELSRGADLRVSLSALTLPHRLARVLLAEQIYRAFTILRGEPYSH
ncbi:MAG: 23S rRNA (pseudouridine(1915)-N(3))-methyltransferase RlmH [Sandaracinaceae bacterium]|nr:23S rRNA (pseudouridine(1915)-N(3))-methyltransferase RlmH [Sandaracinaceae bacterium]